jgi:DNA polymerase III subunit beta
VKAGAFILVIRLMSGDFPDYKGIVKAINKAKYITVNRKTMMHSLKRVNIFTEDRFNAVSFVIENNKITLSSQNMDYGSAKEDITVEYEGDTMQLGFNGKYFYESLQVMESNNIKAYINSEDSPCLIQGDEDPGYLSVVMPMKL